MTKPIHVGLLVLVYCEPIAQFAAICRQRNPHNMDGPNNTIKEQSFAGCYQITVHGKPEGNETPGETLARETLQEIGRTAAYDLLGCGDQFYPELIVKNEKEEAEFWTYLAFRPERFLELIRMDVSGTPRLIHETRLEQVLVTDRSKDKAGVTDGSIKFFNDERDALFAAFKAARGKNFASLRRYFDKRLITLEQEVLQ